MALKPVKGKIESQELNDNFSYLESLVKVGGGVNLEVLNTLDELHSTFPDGKSGAVIVKETGYWYYWNGTEWTSGGNFVQTEFDDVLTEQDEEWVI